MSRLPYLTALSSAVISKLVCSDYACCAQGQAIFKCAITDGSVERGTGYILAVALAMRIRLPKNTVAQLRYRYMTGRLSGLITMI